MADNFDQNVGNKGRNLGNLESSQVHEHIVDNNKRMAQNYDQANVELSGFKPTENVFKGHDQVNRENILGNNPASRDPFFDTKRELPSEREDTGNLHGNKGKNLGNLESDQVHEHIVDNNKRMAQNFDQAKVELSSFKPTENKVVGQEGNNRENILGNDPNSRDPFFDTKRELPSDKLDQGNLHGNKGKNLGNLESSQIHEHIVDNNKRMAQNFDQAKVELSSFKPTENKVVGQEGNNRENILGNDPNSRDPFFDTKRELPNEGQGTGNLHGNKGRNLGNLESSEIHEHIVDNNKRMAQNFDQAKIELSSFKPTENKVVGQEGNNRENILGNNLSTRDPFFDTKREFADEGRNLHGNKGANLGNIESKDLRSHLISNNEKMASNFEQAHVQLSNFKPTENKFKGSDKDTSHKSLDTLGNKLLTAKDQDFTRSQEGGRSGEFAGKQGPLHGNKGANLGNLQSDQIHGRIIDNNRRMAENYENANVELSNFKPTENAFRGHEENLRENILGNDPNSRDPFFDTKRDLPGEQGRLHGNKGYNAGNLEAKDLKSHLVDNNKKMASNYGNANVELSGFKPTENVFRGREEPNKENILGNKDANLSGTA